MIYVLIGISGSGKSTWAHNKWKKIPLGTIVVNRDKIRELLFGYNETNISEYYDRDDIYDLEKKVSFCEGNLITSACKMDLDVIVDATHLKVDYLKKYTAFPFYKFILFDTSLETCIERAAFRNRKVEKAIIENQYSNLQKLKNSSWFNLQKYVIV